MSIVNRIRIENDVCSIWEKEFDDGTGMGWELVSRYIAIQILRHRIDQELNMVPVSVMELELAGLEKVCV